MSGFVCLIDLLFSVLQISLMFIRPSGLRKVPRRTLKVNLVSDVHTDGECLEGLAHLKIKGSIPNIRCVFTDAVGEEESDLTEPESEPAPVEPVILKPLPQCGHEEPQPSTSSSSLHFFDIPLSTRSGNCPPRRVCTFLQVGLIRKHHLNKCTVKAKTFSKSHLICFEACRFSRSYHKEACPLSADFALWRFGCANANSFL